MATSEGTGELAPGVPVELVEVRADGLMEGLRASERQLDALPDDVVARIEAWDPERRARVWRPFFSAGKPVAGRPTYGARPVEMQALEDKTRMDAVLRAAEEEARVRVAVGPASGGSYLSVQFLDVEPSIGPPLAGQVASWFPVLEATFGIPIGALESMTP